jgi:tRNA A37 methylthiotransferase MiaB
MDDDKFYSIYPQLAKYRDQITLLSEEPDRDDTRETKTHKFKENANIYTKNFIVIQNGCDSHCSFCLTVSKR